MRYLHSNRSSFARTTYSFQGQERDDEVGGVGNSYTADFWQYDPRIGRRWNPDPIIKPYRSPFDVLSNNPIIMIDPKGEDDYYNADGSYNKKMSAKYNNNGFHNIYVLSADGKSSKLLSDMPIRTKNEKKVVERVISVYARKVGITGGIKIGVFNKVYGELPLAATHNQKVEINGYGGEISDLFSNYKNLQSVLFHEKLHQNDQKLGKFFNDYSFEGLLNHSKIYFHQINDIQTFNYTTEDFKDRIIGSFSNYLEKTLVETSNTFETDNNINKVINIINSFNKNKGKEFGYAIYSTEKNIGGDFNTYEVSLKKSEKKK